MMRSKLIYFSVVALAITCGCDKNPPKKQSAIITNRPATQPAENQNHSKPSKAGASAKEPASTMVAIDYTNATDKWNDQQNLKAFKKGYPDRSIKPTPPVKSPVAVTAEQVCSEFARDARAANVKFNSAPASISGVILMVAKGEPGEIIIAGTEHYCVTVLADRSAPGELDLRPGQTVQMKGKLIVDFSVANNPHLVYVAEIAVTSRKAPTQAPNGMLSLTGDEFVDRLAKNALKARTEDHRFDRPVLLCGTVTSTGKSAANTKTTIHIAGRNKEIACVLADPHPIEIKIGQRVNLVGSLDSNRLEHCYFYAGQPVR